jgi:uncharacterized membrane protein
MHPFSGPCGGRLADRGGRPEGIASMAAYLAFWAAVVVVAKREVDARWPRGAGRPSASDPAREALRVRYARGEVDRDTFLATWADLTAGSSDLTP